MTDELQEPPPERREKISYVGAPAIFALELACKQINNAFGEFGCYLVGSATKRPDWRDVDVRFIMQDGDFARLFPHAGEHWEHDQLWLILTVSIAEWLKKQTGLPIDFQFQPQSHSSTRHKAPRIPLGLRFRDTDPGEQNR